MYLRPTGTLVAVGMPGGEATMNVPIVLMVAKVLCRCFIPLSPVLKT